MEKQKVKASLHVGIFGPGLSGKTTLAKHLAESYASGFGLHSIVFDPNEEEWPEGSFVTADKEEFWRVVWASFNCMVFVDEAGETIKRDNDQTPLFTRSRHRGHKLHVMGHSATDLLPKMRQQLSTLFLFRQPPVAANIWAETFCDKRLLECGSLEQYEFLKADLWGDVKKMKLRLP